MIRSTPITLLCCLWLVGAGCNQTKPSKTTADAAAPKAKPAKPAKVPPKVAADPVVAAVRAVVESCKIAPGGVIVAKSCKRYAVRKELSKALRRQAPKQTLLALCQMLAQPKTPTYMLANAQLGRFAYMSASVGAADPKVFACLQQRLEQAQTAVGARRIARIYSMVGLFLKRDAEVFKTFEGKLRFPEARWSGFEGFWSGGRMRTFDRLAKVLQTKDAPVAFKRSVIQGFGSAGRLKPDEEKAVCGLLLPMLKSDNAEIAGAVAFRSFAICKDAKKGILANAPARIKKGTLSPSYVFGLSALARAARRRKDKATTAKVVKMLGKVVAQAQLGPTTRRVAFSTLDQLEPKQAATLAKKFAKDPSKPVSMLAKRILKKHEKKPRKR